MLQTKRSVKNLNGDEEMELAKLVDELDGMDSEISLWTNQRKDRRSRWT